MSNAQPKIIDFSLLFRVVLFAFPIPLIAVLASTLVGSSIDSKMNAQMIRYVKDNEGIDISNDSVRLQQYSLANICSAAASAKSIQEVCSFRDDVSNLSVAGITTIVITSLLIAFIIALGQFARASRLLLVASFRVGLWITQLSVAGLVLANAGLAIASVYLLESWFIERVHVGLILGVGFVAGITALRIAASAFTLIHKVNARVLGRRIEKSSHPEIWLLVEQAARKVGTASPDHIVVGLDPTFFVTETQVTCLDGSIRGRTLFLSLPYCRVLSKEELLAVIGHELGHFVGLDTQYSKWFFPIYRGAQETLQTLSNTMSNQQNGASGVALLPSLFLMSFFLSSFSRLESQISRQRELAADAVGASLGSREAMASSLVKVHAFGQAWTFTQQEMRDSLEEGKYIKNISEFFSTVIGLVPESVFKNDLAQKTTTHPTDSHPPLGDRLINLGADVERTINLAIANRPAESHQASSLFKNVSEIESELSNIEQAVLLQGRQKLNAPSPGQANENGVA